MLSKQTQVSSNLENKLAHGLHVKVVDLSKETLPESTWQPIKKAQRKTTPQRIRKDKILYDEWKAKMFNQQMRHVYDYRNLESEVFRNFKYLGKQLRDSPNQEELLCDIHFQRDQTMAESKARQHIKDLKGFKLYDSVNLKPHDSFLPLNTHLRDGSLPMMSRGPDIQQTTTAECQKLKHYLERGDIRLPNQTLKRAIIVPKDIDSRVASYPKPGDSLPRNVFKDPVWLREQAQKEAVLLGITLKQQRRLARKRAREAREEKEKEMGFLRRKRKGSKVKRRREVNKVVTKLYYYT